jgi:hypothetical protein
MSFNDLKLSDLKKVAESFGVDLPVKISKNDLVLLLEEEGISYKMYEDLSNSEKEKIEPIDEEQLKRNEQLKNETTILVKMDRNNFSYQVGPYTFTQENPFIAMPESHAQRVFDIAEGFRPATPREVQDFYS